MTYDEYIETFRDLFHDNRWSIRGDLLESEMNDLLEKLQALYNVSMKKNNSLRKPDNPLPSPQYLIYFAFRNTGKAEVDERYLAYEQHDSIGEVQTALIVRSFPNPITDASEFLETHFSGDIDHDEETFNLFSAYDIHPAFQVRNLSRNSFQYLDNGPYYFQPANDFNALVVYPVTEEQLIPLQKYLDHPIAGVPETLFGDISSPL